VAHFSSTRLNAVRLLAGGVAGAGAPAEGGGVRLAAFSVKSFRSFALQNSTPFAARLEPGGRLPPSCSIFIEVKEAKDEQSNGAGNRFVF
jgi:hypothetical protein